MRILELFSGYGTASFALKRLGFSYELVGYSDIDKFANQCFKQNHCPGDVADELRLGDVTKVNPFELGDFDLLTGGFPCQAFSIAGHQKGELDPRGSLFYEIIRIAEVKKPKYMLLENVKGLTSKKFKDTFDKILSELDRIGYVVYWKVLNSKDFGVPQSRARVWFVCFRKDVSHSFSFPEKKSLNLFIRDVLDDVVDEKYLLKKSQVEKLLDALAKKSMRARRLQDVNSFCSSLLSRDYKDVKVVQWDMSGKGYKSQQDRAYCVDGVMCCLPNANPSNKVNIYDNHRKDEIKLRRFTPKECFRLMGFLNDEINIDGLSDTQRYKLAGNGQDVNMVSLLFERMFKNNKKFCLNDWL